ncbi:hypothetical protein DICSQDRAFT_75864 [Dichomitus squalens LYAD-421 SS1]|uniref:uncharacterized protein n=1 Tax=Dichomitus squalens (strain LYAD-421) TaxID=732165 RepID=UPI0004410F0C|nr:uncharacterized protein DICSQDRAFT_75864 [Dichomitus squalens LYAD-421 SS1]EJF66798.1 hypothetical protein DICSQDRAFT_75864 [Dichomitus squalens LYAD-421 SS1]
MAPTHILQRALDDAINHPTFAARLPPLSEKRWMEILDSSYEARKENDRLEFVGDALMYAALARQMYQQYPRGSPHFYTCLRAALNSNATFSHIAEKMEFYCVSQMVLRALTERTFGEGVLAPSKSRGAVKLTADLFETMVAAYYWEAGFEELFKWVREIYQPLISATADEYFSYRRQYGPAPLEQRDISAQTRFAPGRLYPGPPRNAPSVYSMKKSSKQVTPIKHRLHTAKQTKARSPRSLNMKRAILGSSNIVPKVVPAKKCLKPAPSANVIQGVQVAPSAKRAILIDLTQDSDSESDDERPSGSHSRATPLRSRRTVAVSKQPTAPPGLPLPRTSAVQGAGLTMTMANPAGYGSLDTDSESDDEMLLVSMLTTDSLGSDMDCTSSDVELPIGVWQVGRSR